MEEREPLYHSGPFFMEVNGFLCDFRHAAYAPKNYKTFTIDESKFNNPKEMFAQLKKQGVKYESVLPDIVFDRPAGKR